MAGDEIVEDVLVVVVDNVVDESPTTLAELVEECYIVLENVFDLVKISILCSFQ